MRELGQVKFVQIQRSPMKIFRDGARLYDPAPLLRVDALLLTPDGAFGLMADGARIIDVHHREHPQTRNRNDNPLSFSFSSHYAAMRQRYGDHLREGIAGENILIEFSEKVRPEQINGKIMILSAETGQPIYLTRVIPARPASSSVDS